MHRSQTRTRAWLAGLAFCGVISAHLLAYVLVAPDDHHRAELLRSTGHGSWAVVVGLALAALVATLAGFALRVARGPASQPSFWSCGLRLAALQAIGFAGLESVERFLHEGLQPDIFAEPVFLIGIVAQLVVAVVGAGLLTLFARAIQHLIARRRSSLSRRPAPAFAPVLRAVAPRRLIASGSGTLRGPPVRV